MNRLIVLIILLGCIFLSTSLSGGGVGMSSSCYNGFCVVSASSSLGSSILAVVLAFFVLFFPHRSQVTEQSKVVGIWRRFGAFLLDFILVIIVMAPLVALPLLLAEANAAGTFEWQFYREFSRPTDNLFLLPGIFFMFFVLISYFYGHLKFSRQPVGQYIMGYAIAPSDEGEANPKYAKRVLMSAIGLSVWPVSIILALIRKDKSFWWDRVSSTQAVRVSKVKTDRQPSENGGD